MSSSRDTSREEPELYELLIDIAASDPNEDSLTRKAAWDEIKRRDASLREAYHYACAEVARWRAWYGFADFGLTEAPDEQVQDVQDEFLGKARP